MAPGTIGRILEIIGLKRSQAPGRANEDRRLPRTQVKAERTFDQFDLQSRVGENVTTIDLTVAQRGVDFPVTLMVGQSVAVKTEKATYHLSLESGSHAFLAIRNPDGKALLPVYMTADILTNLSLRVERVAGTSGQFIVSQLSRIPFTNEPYCLRPGDAVEIEINNEVYVLGRSPQGTSYMLSANGDRPISNRSVNRDRTSEIFDDNVVIKIVERRDGELGVCLSVNQDSNATVFIPLGLFAEAKVERPIVEPTSGEGRAIVNQLNAYLASENFAIHLNDRYPNRPGGQWFVGLQLDPSTGKVLDESRDDQCNLSLYFDTKTVSMDRFTLGKDTIHLAKCMSDVQVIWNLDKPSPGEGAATIVE